MGSAQSQTMLPPPCLMRTWPKPTSPIASSSAGCLPDSSSQIAASWRSTVGKPVLHCNVGSAIRGAGRRAGPRVKTLSSFICVASFRMTRCGIASQRRSGLPGVRKGVQRLIEQPCLPLRIEGVNSTDVPPSRCTAAISCTKAMISSDVMSILALLLFARQTGALSACVPPLEILILTGLHQRNHRLQIVARTAHEAHGIHAGGIVQKAHLADTTDGHDQCVIQDAAPVT